MRQTPLRNTTILSCLLFIAAISVALVPAISMAQAAKHVTEARDAAQEAVKYGKKGHIENLGKQAEKALRHVQMMQKDFKGNTHVQAAMASLEDAVLEAKQGHADKGTEAAEEDVMHLAEVK